MPDAATGQALAEATPPASRPPAEPPARIVIQYPAPTVDGGRFAPKRCVGDVVEVEADVFRDGHEKLRAVVRHRAPGDDRWREAPLTALDAHHAGVRWGGSFLVDRQGSWQWTVEAWTDVWGTWRDELRRKLAAGQTDLAGELSEGAVLLADAAARAADPQDGAVLGHALDLLRDPAAPAEAKFDAALGEALHEAVERQAERHGAVSLPALPLEVDRVRARFSSWYELFPRSWGGLAGVERQVPGIAALGFDVLYLPPIHPIGRTNRKGKNNSLVAGPDDPGSPYAIGGPEGGHDAVHPDLGTLEAVRSLCATAREHGMDVALDLAINCSADHPWLTEHPEWFHRRPDGTLKYAENPPKRYQDIYNVNWESPDWRGLWEELRRVVLHWVDCGIKVFRVDNPHTKPLPFWEWLIGEVHAVDRDVIFLAEAFTRRAMMRALAKLGFTQSYTYFTWKTTRWDLTEYVSELAHSDEREYFRPNFFTNTPDILHEYLQHGGPAAFYTRLVLATTLSPSYGIYSGYEHFENVPVHEGSEEYLDSEKYEVRHRALDGPMLPFIARVNRIRHENPALQQLSDVTFLETENDAIIAYAKQVPGNTLICAVNLDPHHFQSGVAVVPPDLGLPLAYRVHDLLTDERFDWWTGRNYVGLDPAFRQAHILRVEH
jgi:starch synthase (maltosyl-transferring)